MVHTLELNNPHKGKAIMVGQLSQQKVKLIQKIAEFDRKYSQVFLFPYIVSKLLRILS